MLFLFIFSRWDVVCLCIHWEAQDTKLHPFLIHANSVYTICIISFFQYNPFSTNKSGKMVGVVELSIPGPEKQRRLKPRSVLLLPLVFFLGLE